MSGESAGERAGLKGIGLVLLLPLAAVNVYVAVAGIGGIASPGFLGAGPGVFALFLGLVGLGLQVILMNAARRHPLGVGITFGLIGLAIFGFGALAGALSSWLMVAVLGSPFPGSAVLIYAGWIEARRRAPEQWEWNARTLT